MRKILIITMCVLLLLGLCSCQKNEDRKAEDAYLEGVDQGEENIFSSLVNASNFDAILNYNELWETEDFSISFTDLQVEANYTAAYDEYDHMLRCRLSLNDCSLDEAYEEKNLYIGLYSRTADGKWSELASDYESYYTSAILDDNYTWGDNSAEAEFQLYDSPKYVVAIVVIDGELYKISYHCQG